MSDIARHTLEWIDNLVIFQLIPIILCLIYVDGFVKNKYQPKKVLNIVRWVVIVYSFLSLVFLLFELITPREESVLPARLQGPYASAYFFMLFFAVIFPFTLLIRRFASSYWYALVVVLLLKSGFYFERFTILMTSLHRDFSSESNAAIFLNELISLFTRFVVGAVLAYLLLKWISPKALEKENR